MLKSKVKALFETIQANLSKAMARTGRNKSGNKKKDKLSEYRYFLWQGQTYLVNLEWTGDKPSFFSRYPEHFEWRQAHVVVDSRIEQECHVLMQMVAGRLGIQEDEKWRGATRVVICSDPQTSFDPFWWSAVFHDGLPVYGRETLTDDLKWLLTHVQDECNKGAINRLIAPAEFLESVRNQKVITSQLEEFNSKWKLPEEEPLFFRTRYQPTLFKAVLILPLLMVVFIGGYIVLLLDPDKRLLVEVGLEEPPAVIAEVHPHVIDWQNFAISCTEAQARSWPAAPGWNMETSGCTASGMQDPQHQPFFPSPDIGMAYRIYKTLPGHHEWLTAQAATITTRKWEGSITITPENMILARQLDLTLIPWVDRGHDLEKLGEHVHRNFLGTAESIEESSTRMIVRTDVRDGNVLPILQKLQERTSFGLYAMSRSNGKLELSLGPPNILQLGGLP